MSSTSPPPQSPKFMVSYVFPSPPLPRTSGARTVYPLWHQYWMKG